MLPVLATWLGRTTPAETYWYLTGTAELLDAAAERLRAYDDTAGRQEGGRP